MRLEGVVLEANGRGFTLAELLIVIVLLLVSIVGWPVRAQIVVTDPAVTLRMPRADLLRLAAGDNPGAVLLAGRTSVEGDLNVAIRLPEMFGAPSPY